MRDAPVPAGDPIPVVTHHARAAWRDGDRDSAANAALRHRELAAAGPRALAAQMGAAADEVPRGFRVAPGTPLCTCRGSGSRSPGQAARTSRAGAAVPGCSGAVTRAR